MASKRPRSEDPEEPSEKKQKTDISKSVISQAGPSQPTRRSRRLEERRSDESTQSTDTSKSVISQASSISVFPPQSDITTATGATFSPGPSKMAQPAADLSEYYVGLPGNPKLLARSSRAPWEGIPIISTPGGHEGDRSHACKLAFVVTHHPLRQKLEGGLRANIRHVLATMSPCKWISVDYLRLGYDDKIEQNNPVVVLITVEEDQVPQAEAQRIVDTLSEECRGADLPDVEVEVMEGQRANASGLKNFAEPLLTPQHYPLVGSSIAPSSVHGGGCGTLAGYIQVDGKVMGLTNNHVAFKGTRVEAFPSELEKSTGVSYTLMQPAESDLKAEVDGLEYRRGEMVQDQKDTQDPDLKAREISEIDAELKGLELWKNSASVLGKVSRSSGLRAGGGPPGRRFRMDWALIELENPGRFTEGESFVNKLPDRTMLRSTSNPYYVTRAVRTTGGDISNTRLPSYLKRGLSLDEIFNKKEIAEDNSNKLVVWKFGRTTHFTFGIISGILTDYMDSNGVVSDELAVVDYNKQGIHHDFSHDGDSGSFVWDFEGYVCGLLWGGKFQTSVTYVTPIEYVLEDIKRVYNAKEVKLIVR